MEKEQPLEIQVQQLIDSTVELYNSIIIQEIKAQAVVNTSTKSENEISENLKTLISKKIMIESIEFADQGNNKKELSFTVKYRLDQYEKEESVKSLINNKLETSITTKKEKKQYHYFENEDQFKDLLSEKENEKIKENQEKTQNLYQKINELEKFQQRARITLEEQIESIKSLNKTIEKYKKAFTADKELRDQEISKKDGLEKEFNNQTKEKSKKEQNIIEGKKMINDLVKKVEEQEKDIKTNEQQKRQQQTLSAKEEEVKKNQNQIDQLQQELLSNQNEIKSLQQQIETLEIQYIDKQNDQLEHEKQIFKLKQRIKTQEYQIELQLIKLSKLNLFDQNRRKSQ
ncbi:hypothetical protein TTHERM_00974110 (macronuclear) [Tetrahymena thermophila SB210]|uniref:Uncharacterized protein n=1 Tax=Tetrahymena thermophila (strain SB210) TaxID=312017 RepID=Q22WS3_TETTS|nr:hypothetical protein TTHERM_00974110 [Tetrahymena thermophila SB210]EAR89719.4 hypothetical protein TTHERM_00974110 [Tetrahymena thermophila SB210]|eukprot:XP_001009964.4 hypothetical protein TTHERM_00974110 [Tetrahymena thermophila SB210]